MKILSILLFLGILFSCENNQSTKEPFSSIEKNKDFIEANNKFAFDLFKKVYNEEIKENLMISPVSLSLAMGMTYNGAEKETKIAFENTLNYTEFIPAEINNLNKEIIYNLSDNASGTIFEVANSIWTEKAFPVKDKFINTNKAFYNAEVQNLDFSDGNSLNIINNWVADKTYQKIPTIIDELSPSLKMILVNALYFKSDWKYNFKEENTKKLPFYGENTTENVQMMHLTNELPFYESENFSSVKLPYNNEKFSMTIFLPKENQTISDIINLLDVENWQQWNKNYFSTAVNLEMPKFKLSYKKKLNKAVSELGLGLAFTDAANFNGISNSTLEISYILQKTFIEVDEKGTEAAAVTAVGISTMSIGLPNKTLRLNKPFLYTITEKETGSICFLGKVGMPKNEL
jgi:serpin B